MSTRLLTAEILEDGHEVPVAQRKYGVRFTFETDDLEWARALASKLGETCPTGPAWPASGGEGK